jgi:type II secretory pathway pseudopilin PulG
MKKKHIIIIVIILLLVAVRLALPSIAKKQINKTINGIEGYHGHVDEVRLALIAGQFWVNDIKIFEETAVDSTIPMINLPALWFSIEWRSLFRGRIVASIEIDSLTLNLIKAKEAQKDQVMENRISFAEKVMEMNPITINTIKITNTNILYRNPNVTPEINIGLTSFDMQAYNLGNVIDKNDSLPARYNMNATFMNTGQLFSEGRMNVLKEIPDFDIDFQLEEAEVKEIEEYTDHHANLEIESGLLYLYLELLAVDGAVEGYVKPLLEGVQIEEKDDSGALQKVYESVVQGVVNIFENPEKEQIGVRVEIEGSLNDPDVNVWETISSLLINAFVEAYNRELERIIGLSGKNPG